jgi:hypothetical protein
MKISLANSSISLLFLLIFAGFTWVAPVNVTAQGNIINAVSCSQAAVQAAINSVQNGGTVNVPAGSCTWSGSITVSKDVSIIGAGPIVLQGAAGGTNITRIGEVFALDMSKTTRISGFNFVNGGVINSTGLPASGKTFRIDHNSFYSSAWTENDFDGGCQTPMRHPTGLLDNNIVFNYRFATVRGTNCLPLEGNYQNQLWAQNVPIGTGDGIIYLEDNQFFGDSNCIDWVDGNWGGMYVGRFNTIDGRCIFETHGTGQNGAQERGVRWWEIYKNTHINATDFFGLAFLRSGSGVVWSNRISSGANSFKLNNLRSENRACNGSSNFDQNTPGLNGYACRDQLGRAKDNSIWSVGAAYQQDQMPAYMFLNYIGSGTTRYTPEIHLSGLYGHIAENRDYYLQNDSFNGTSGVGEGPLANRPSSCTTGVGYWATDQGEWNSNQAGPDGQLYKCTAPNTWTLYYTPYQYPHPLQGVIIPPDTTPPAAPAGLTVQ